MKVANAQDELLQWHADQLGDKSHIFVATERCAAGIIQAMQHFNLRPNVSPRDISVPLSVHDKLAPKPDGGAVSREVVEYLLLTEQWLRGDIDASEEAFRRLKFGLVSCNTSTLFTQFLQVVRIHITILPYFPSCRAILYLHRCIDFEWDV